MTETHSVSEILSIVRTKEAAHALLAQAALQKEASQVGADAVVVLSGLVVDGTTPVAMEEVR
jgi:uncharacterized protein YbjQ (UPF0145 family)